MSLDDSRWRAKTLCELPQGRMGPQIVSRRRRAADISQSVSWFNPNGHPNHPDLVGQVFFKTDDRQLDAQDREVLTAAIDYYRSYFANFYRSSRILFKFVGNADPRGSAAYNLRLGQQRAEATRAPFDAGFADYPYYTSAAESKGETLGSTSQLANSRRVDIFSNFIIPRDQSVSFDNYLLQGKYHGDKSQTFKIRSLGGGGLAVGPVGFTIVTFEIRNPRTERRASYTLTSATVGTSFGLNRPTSSWTDVNVGSFMDVDDFEGSGRIAVSVSAGVAGGQVLQFDGPMERGLSTRPVTVGLDGWDLNLGLTADVFGYWHRR